MQHVPSVWERNANGKLSASSHKTRLKISQSSASWQCLSSKSLESWEEGTVGPVKKTCSEVAAKVIKGS